MPSPRLYDVNSGGTGGYTQNVAANATELTTNLAFLQDNYGSLLVTAHLYSWGFPAFDTDCTISGIDFRLLIHGEQTFPGYDTIPPVTVNAGVTLTFSAGVYIEIVNDAGELGIVGTDDTSTIIVKEDNCVYQNYAGWWMAGTYTWDNVNNRWDPNPVTP